MSAVPSGNTADRPYLDKAHPALYKLLLEASAESRAASREAGLSDALLELVNTRVSQINGCVTCLSVHSPAARKAGVEQLTLDLLPAWREASCFSAAERAALGLAEALTTPDPVALVAAQREVAAQMSTAGLAALEWAITLINAFNRISIASGHPPRIPR